MYEKVKMQFEIPVHQASGNRSYFEEQLKVTLLPTIAFLFCAALICRNYLLGPHIPCDKYLPAP